MTASTPAIRINVDPTNPGQFFACCGLFELANRVWPEAEAWFATDGREFQIACAGSLTDLLRQLAKSVLTSSLGKDGLKRLGSLLSANKATLSAAAKEEKDRLRAAWQVERIHLSVPFDLWLDWWWDERSGVKLLKTWAAKQFVLEIVEPMLQALAEMDWTDQSATDCLNRTAKLSGLPFYFDAANNTQNTPRDNGFAPFIAKPAETGNDRPLVELLTFIGLQRFRPDRPEKSQQIRYTLWMKPLPVAVAAAATAGRLELPDDRTFEFRMLYRTEYMKAFLPAQPYRGV